MPEIIASAIERLVTTEMRPGSGNMPRGYVQQLHAAALAQNDGVPTTLAAAEGLSSVMQGDGRVLILTGAGVGPQWPNGEIDGLLGAAALARVLRELGNNEVTLLTEGRIIEPLRLTLMGAGLNVSDEDSPDRPWNVRLVELPMEEDGGAFARDLLARGPRVKGVVAIEKGGPNSAGILHYSTGVDCTDSHGKAHYIVNFAREMGAFTVGVGDGGNEIGFGNIYDTAAQVMPQGSVCQCPCAGGAATVTKTDALLVGAVSNWAAYGLVSMMAYLARRPELVPSAGDVRRMMEGALQGGALDGLYAAPRFCDDGIPLAVHEALATMLGNIVATGLRSYHSVGH